MLVTVDGGALVVRYGAVPFAVTSFHLSPLLVHFQAAHESRVAGSPIDHQTAMKTTRLHVRR